MTVLDQTTELALSAAMREGSMAEHQAAEDSSFMSELLGGRVNERGYADYLLRLRVVYATMEEIVAAHRDDPPWPPSPTTALERLAAIDADLDHWLADGEGRSVDSPAADGLPPAPAGRGRRVADPAGRAPLHALPRRPVRRPGDRPHPRPHLRARRRRHRVLRLPRDREAEDLQGRLPRPPRRARPRRRGAGARRHRGQDGVPAQPGALRRARRSTSTAYAR